MRSVTNITLSADSAVVRRARELARRRGKSLNALVRDYLRSLTAMSPEHSPAADLFDLMDRGKGSLRGGRWSRSEAHDR
jgi:hypothetical protein